MRLKIMLALLALGPATSLASDDDDCKFRADRAAAVDAKGVEKVLIRAGAGDLKVAGTSNAARIEARGVACAGKQALLDASQVSVRREGNVVIIETALPQYEDGWTWMNNDYAYLDLGVTLPSGLPVEAIDSSGDAEFADLHSLNLQDSSGDLEVSRIAGALDVTDSSGDLEIENAGSVRLRDSSGDVEVNDVSSDVTVLSDSSGDLRIARVKRDVTVEQDSSGNIRVEEVKGSVVVRSDSSGDIYAGRVNGDFTVNEDGSGSITHDSISGKINLPSNHSD
jgi:hypothetical protein